MFVIGFQPSPKFPPLVLTERLTWMAELEDAAKFDTEAEAADFMAKAKVNGKRGHFGRNTKVYSIN